MPESKKDHKFVKGTLCGVLLMCVIFVGLVVTDVVHFAGAQRLTEITEDIGTDGQQEIVIDNAVETKLELIQKLAEKYFLYDVDEEALKEGLYSGYVDALDDIYTTYYDEEETKELMESTTGVYSGVGAVLTQQTDTKLIQVLSVYKDSPAEEAGLKEDDVIYSVDGREIEDEELSEIVGWIKGEEGSQVVLGVYRERGVGNEELELTATRRKIEAQTVEYEMKENQTGYLRITEFDSVTQDQFANALDALEQQGMERLIIDLRSNPGGNLDTVCEMLRMILPEGMIVYTEDKDGKRDTEYFNEEDHTFEKPLVVLVNGMSASASEIFAGAVQDYGVGKIVGTTTYGKGVVQRLVDLQDGTCLKLTIAQYFTAKGRNIHGKGIEPDITVEFEVNEQDEDADNQLEKAMEIVGENP
ncbi:MAG: S41 family peptidase [Hespellia sp.]|nr:S41 family peptidase [Hespellia sp.]